MKVLMVGRVFENYPRTEAIRNGLESLDEDQTIEFIDETETEPLWFSEQDATKRHPTKQWFVDNVPLIYALARRVKNGLLSVLSVIPLILKVMDLRRRIKAHDPDVVIVPGENHWLAVGLGMVLDRKSTTVYYDLFISEYSRDRDRPGWLTFPGLSWLKEQLVIKSIDRFFVFSEEYRTYYQETFYLGDGGLDVLPKECQEEWLRRETQDQPYRDLIEGESPLRVIYWGSFLPHHGLDNLLDAANRLRGEPIEFVLCGDGLLRSEIEDEVEARELTNVTFTGYLDRTELIDEVDRSHLAVGHLSTNHDADLIAPNKLVQGMARARVVLSTGSSHLERFYALDDLSNPPIVRVEEKGEAIAEWLGEAIRNPEALPRAASLAREKVRELHPPGIVGDRLREVLATDE